MPIPALAEVQVALEDAVAEVTGLSGYDLKRVMRGKLVLGIGDGWLKADGETIYKATDLRVGLFQAA